MVYTSTDNDLIKKIAKLKDKKARMQSGLFLVEGEHLILEAYNQGYLKTFIKKEDSSLQLDIETIVVNTKVLNYLSTLQTPTMIGVCYQKKDIIRGNRLLILDNIQDPGNLGTIIRSAVAFNIDTIVLSENTVDLYNEKVIRATQGLLFKVGLVRTDITQLIPKLKHENYQVYATKVNGGKNLKNIEKPQKFAIIMGNEGQGVRASILALCSDYLYINMNQACESLNVGVAASIILYELDK